MGHPKYNKESEYNSELMCTHSMKCKLPVLEPHIVFSPSCKAQPSDARNSLPTKLQKFKNYKTINKKQRSKSHLFFKGQNDCFGAASISSNNAV